MKLCEEIKFNCLIQEKKEGWFCNFFDAFVARFVEIFSQCILIFEYVMFCCVYSNFFSKKLACCEIKTTKFNAQTKI